MAGRRRRHTWFDRATGRGDAPTVTSEGTICPFLIISATMFPAHSRCMAVCSQEFSTPMASWQCSRQPRCTTGRHGRRSASAHPPCRQVVRNAVVCSRSRRSGGKNCDGDSPSGDPDFMWALRRSPADRWTSPKSRTCVACDSARRRERDASTTGRRHVQAVQISDLE